MARPLTRILTLTLIALLGTTTLAATVAAEDPAKTPGNAFLKGIVQDADGKPVGSASVLYSSYDPYAYVQYYTGPDGSYYLEAPPGKGTLVVSAKGFERAELPAEIPAEGATLPVTLKLLPPATAILEGRVLDADGNPIAGAPVYLNRVYTPEAKPMPMDAASEPAGNGTSASAGMTRPAIWCCEYDPRAEGKQTTTDENGRFTLTHYGGDYTLTIRAKGFIPLQDERVTLVDDSTITHDVTLKAVPKDTVTLTGVVRDAATGIPVANARVDVYNVQWSRWYESVPTDAAGTYTLQVLPGYTRIQASAERQMYGYAIGGAPEADTPVSSDAKLIMPPGGSTVGATRNYYPATAYVNAADGATVSQDFSLLPKADPTIVLIGYVVDEKAQKGIPGATVYVSNLVTGEWGHAVTDATGSYKILVNPGYLSLSTWVDGYFERNEYLPIQEDDTNVRHDLLLTEGRSVWIDWYSYDGGAGYDARPMDLKAGEAVSRESADNDANTGATAGGTNAPAAPLGTSRSASAGGSGPMAYQGTGGGLGPYQPEAATDGAEPGTDSGNAAPEKTLRTVPGAGILLAGLAVAAALVIARRR